MFMQMKWRLKVDIKNIEYLTDENPYKKQRS